MLTWEPEERFDLLRVSLSGSDTCRSRGSTRSGTPSVARPTASSWATRCRRTCAHLWERSGEREVRRLADGRGRDRQAALVARDVGGAPRRARLGERPAHEFGRQPRLRHGNDGSVTARARRACRDGRKRADAPNSGYLVGAVALARDGTVVEGVNVENAANPLGCARSGRPSRAQSSRATARGTSRPSGSTRRPAADPAGGCTSPRRTGLLPARGRLVAEYGRPSCSRTRGSCRIGQVPGAALGEPAGGTVRRTGPERSVRPAPSARRSAVRRAGAEGGRGRKKRIGRRRGRPNVGNSTL